MVGAQFSDSNSKLSKLRMASVERLAPLFKSLDEAMEKKHSNNPGNCAANASLSSTARVSSKRHVLSLRQRKLVLELFSFMGRFLGLAITCGERLDISFAPHVARYLMGQPANISDLRFLIQICISSLLIFSG